MHKRNIVHRDIKIENILMNNYNNDAQLRIADLGSAIKLRKASDTTNF